MPLDRYSPLSIKFSKGQISDPDPSIIPYEGFAELINLVLDKRSALTKPVGTQKYNATEIGSSTPIQGGIAFIGEDGTEYEIVACNNGLHYTSGNGTYTAIKFKTDNVAVLVDTVNYQHEFIVFPRTVAGTTTWKVFVICEDYPIVNGAAGTNTPNKAIYRAIELSIDSGVIIAKGIYYDSAGALTAGADEQEIGSGAGEAGWPQGGKFGLVLFDRIFIFKGNNYYYCESQDAYDWTPASGSNVGGGKSPNDFIGAIAYGSSFLAYTRRSVLKTLISPSAPTNWREEYLKTNYGCVGQRALCLHNDGWVYFLSEEGICRTDGQRVERVDIDIQDAISQLPQLQQKKYSWALNSKTDWDGGTVGTEQIDTTNGILKQLPQNTIKQFDKATLTDLDIGTQWQGAGETWAYHSSGTITVPAGAVAKYTIGNWIKWTQTTVKYAQITNVADTLLTVSGDTVANAAITDNYWTTVDISAEGNVKLSGIADINQITVNMAFTSTGPTAKQIIGERFKSPSVNTILNNVRVSLSKSCAGAMGSNIAFELRSDNAGRPGTVIYSTAIKESDLQQTPIYRWQQFNPGQALTANTYYWIMIYKQVTSTDYILWAGNTPITYANGYAYWDGDIQTAHNTVFALHFQNYYSTGNIVSQKIDYGATPTTLGKMCGRCSLPSGTGIHMYLRTSADGTTWGAYNDLGAVADGNFTCDLTAITPLRYIEWKAVLTSDTGQTYTPILYSVYVGAQYLSATKNIGSVPQSSGVFAPEYDAKGQYVLFEIDTSANNSSWTGWATVTPGSIPTLLQYFKYRVTVYSVDYTLIPEIDKLIQYWWTGTAGFGPAMTSHEDRIYLSVQSINGTTNDHCWVGMTKRGLNMTTSDTTSYPLPLWTKLDYIKANVFIRYRALLTFGYSVSGFVYNHSGVLADATIITGTAITAAISSLDVETVWRFLYLYSKSDYAYNLYVRTRYAQGDWSAWSTAKVIAASPYISRQKIELAGLVTGDFLQFKLESVLTDEGLQISGFNLYKQEKEKR